MIYNEDLFNISSEYYVKTDIKNTDVIDEETLQLEKQLLQILLKRFRNIINDKSRNCNGLLKTKFRSRFLSKTDDGYEQIKRLIKLGKFDSFASDYCLYLGNVGYSEEKNCIYYYEIVWDYKTYFETLNMYETKDTLNTKENKIYNKSMTNNI